MIQMPLPEIADEEEILGGEPANMKGNVRFLWPARLGWLLIFLLIAGMFAANWPYRYLDTATEWQVGQALPVGLQLFPSKVAFVRYLMTLRLFAAAVFVGTALFLVWRKFDNRFALFVSASLLLMAFQFGSSFDVSIIRYPEWLVRGLPAIRVLAPALSIISLILLFYLFPDGRFTPRWMVWLVLPATLLILRFFSEAFYDPWRVSLGTLFPGETGWYLFGYTLLGTAVVGLIGQITRYHRASHPEQRQQTKWVLLGLGSLILTPLVEWLFFDLLQLVSYSTRHFISLQLAAIVPVLLPITIAISMLRYRLWQVDIWINRALVYGTLTACVLGLYGLGVGLASTLVAPQNHWLLSSLALGVVVVLAAQLRPRLQKVADRWLPASPRGMQPDETESEPGKEMPVLRLARAVWLLLFAFLLWQLMAHFTAVGDVLAAIRSEWIVQTSLPALPGISANAFARYLLLLRLAVLAVFWGTAVLIFHRQRHDEMALFVAFFLLLAPTSLALSGDENGLEEGLGMVVIGMAVLLFFLFPDGRFTPRSARWRGLLLAAMLTTPFLAYPLVSLSRPNSQPDEKAYGSFIVTIAVAMTAGLVSQVYRYRAVATGTQRQQTKWVLLGLGAIFLWLFWGALWLVGVLARLGVSEPLTALVMVHLVVWGLAALPVTIAISILRYRLWDMDLIINRTLVFGGLTLLVVTAYVLVVGLMGVLFQTGNNVLLSILATGLIAILFHPLRQRLQQVVNRLTYGERDDPVTVLTRLGERLENAAIPGETLPAIVESIGQTLKLPYVAIVVGGPGDSEIVAEHGKPLARTTTFPLVYQGREIGRLLAATRGPGEQFTAAERHLLANVSRQAGPAVYAEQLTSRLQHSRERLVTAREEERRRLRRDLHDGLGPQLATLAIKASAAQNLLQSKPGAAAQLLAEVKAESQSAVREIRRVVDGLRPSVLDQLGLGSAVQEFVAQNGAGGTRFLMQMPDEMPPLPAAVEVAAYRIVTEAVTNVLRHASARTCTVRLETGEALRILIEDDGQGLPDSYEPGVGLDSMHERAAELGGTLEIQSQPGQGTRLVVELPVGESE